MLTEIEYKEIKEEISLYPVKSAASIEALKVVQKHRGWISDENIKDIADFLDLTPEELDGVATYYPMIFRKPTGRNIIYLCDSISCFIMNSETLYQFISNKLGIKWGETTTDGRFTLLPNPCLGDCNHAPVMMINEDHYNQLTPEKVEEILLKYK
jgi:NADH-quinone oxidoreductase subunit E